MPAVRIKFNFNTVTLDGHGRVINGSKSLCGSTVEILHRNGKKNRWDFKGFRVFNADLNHSASFVKVVDVSAFYPDGFLSKAEYVDSNHYCIGVYDYAYQGVYLLLDDNNKLMTRPLEPVQEEKPLDNVVSFPRASTRRK
ncbi:hypothetical protein AAFX24_28565 [Vibrio mediterranei]|uniref:hypothetical protein n=1 Tax=Vibrio mediterranei TaxID=689 RepID=UPI0038CEB705